MSGGSTKGTLVDADYRGASALRSVLNDLKRDIATASAELDLPMLTISLALAGHRESLTIVAEAATDRWPVARRELVTATDDTLDNVVIWTSERSLNSSRTLVRDHLDYYEYRDTAMSRISPIRPEWIKMLARTPCCDAIDPRLRWNRGHGLHQLTFFLGDVDFYYEEGGQRIGRAMHAGDSAFIPSWVPHTFAARDGVTDAAILAVTYRGRMTADAIDELALAWNQVRHNELPGSDRALLGSTLLAKLNEASLTVEWLAVETGIPLARLERILANDHDLEAGEAVAISTTLNISLNFIAGRSDIAGVNIKRASAQESVPYPTTVNPIYRIDSLAVSPVTPDARGLVIEIAAGDLPIKLDHATLRLPLHQYGYVLGSRAIRLVWWSNGQRLEKRLSPGDSFYMKPWTSHAFLQDIGVGYAQLFSFRCRGAIGDDALRELAMQNPQALERFRASQLAWYD